MKRALAAVTAAFMLVVSLAACGGGAQNNNANTNSASKTETTSQSQTEEQSSGNDTLKLVSILKDNIGDRIEYPWNNLQFLGTLTWRSLFLVEPDMATITPNLASDYEVSDDGLTYTIDFIGGSKWSDGEDLTVDDVIFSVKANLLASVSNGIYTSAFSKIEGAESYREAADINGDLPGLTAEGNKIIFKLSSPHNTLPHVLAQFSILPKHCLEGSDMLEIDKADFWTNPVTSGMYKLGELVAGSYYTLVINENYDGVEPKIKKVEVNFAQDTVTAAQAGLVDVINTNDPAVISQLDKIDGMEMFPVDILFYRYFIVNMEGVDGVKNSNEGMMDVRVREAILHAIDRDTLATQLFPGLAGISSSGVAKDHPASIGTDFSYDPEKAKALLAEANYDFNKPIRILYYYSDQTSVDFMNAIAYYLGEVGLKTEVINTQQGTQDLFQTREYDLGYKGLSAFDISEWYGEYSSSNSNFKQIFNGDTSFDAANAQYAAALTQDAKNEALKELQKIEAEKLYKLPLYTIGNNVFVNTNHVSLPSGVVFGNPWYRTNLHYEDWELK